MQPVIFRALAASTLAAASLHAAADDSSFGQRLGYADIRFNTRSGELIGPVGSTPPGVQASVQDTHTLALVGAAAQGECPAHEGRAYAQFGAGPRVCPGRHLARNEIRLVLAMLMRHFHVEHATDPASIGERNAFRMSPSHLPMRLVAR